MKRYGYLLFLFALVLPSQLSGQTLTGVVRDAASGAPLPGVSISLGRTPDADQLALTTGADGSFQTDALKPGVYFCFFQHEGYEPVLLPELRLSSGKETLLNIALQPTNTTLPDVTVKAAASNRRPLQALSEIPLTREQTQRFPATFFDPARLALAYAGVANTDDQANGLSIRGNSPANLLWRLEGLDIVNPNHLPNAGTLADRPALASGGVLLFSAQLLDNSALLTGAFPAGYGNALGGVMDIGLRPGNNHRPEFTAQAGLLGLDLAAEGPLTKNKKASYLANYRYSTVGLLGQMGISFGGETIHFQDLSFKLDFFGKNGGQWSVFGLGGLSENRFMPPADSLDIQVFKDLFRIDFTSKTAILGATHQGVLGEKTGYSIAAAVSGQENERRSTFASDQSLFDLDRSDEQKWSARLQISRPFGTRHRLLAGLQANRQQFQVEARHKGEQPALPDHDFWIAQPWVAYHWHSNSGHTQVQAGLHSLIFPQENRATAEPRLLISQQLSARHRLSLFSGKVSQLASLWIRDRLDVTESWQLGLRHSWQVQERWVLRSELFWQHIRNAAVDPNAPTAFSVLNGSEGPLATGGFAYAGRGENRGLEVTAERYLSEGWFVLANATVFESRYQGSDGRWRAGRWALGHIANLTAGKEWQRDDWPARSRSFGFNGRISWAGGQRAAPVDTVASAAAQRTVYDFSQGYPEKLPGFVRLDLRVYWRRNIGQRRNSLFAMDFQNATIRKNTAYRYFDPYTGRVETKAQLGLVPNLSWRLEW